MQREGLGLLLGGRFSILRPPILRLFSASLQLELKSANGTHLKNKKVILTVSYGSRKQTKTYVTDDTGMASFVLETSAWDNSSKVILQVRNRLLQTNLELSR